MSSNFNYQILHLEQHKDFAFKTEVDFNFARQMTFVPVVLAEIHKVAIELPMFFIASENTVANNETNSGTNSETKEKIDSKSYSLVSLLGMQNNTNIMVNPNGKWSGQYIPAKLRAFPFTLAKITQKDNDDNIKNSLTLCIEQSYLIPPEIVETNANLKQNLIFDEHKNLSEQIKKTLDFLQQTELSNQQTNAIIEILKKHNLITPFIHPTLKLNGLFGVDEKRLNELSAEALKELQTCGGLLLCYSQILSIQNIDKLVYLTNLLLAQQQQFEQIQKMQQIQSQQNQQQLAAKNIAVNTEEFFKGDTINFEGLF